LKNICGVIFKGDNRSVKCIYKSIYGVVFTAQITCKGNTFAIK
jgi:hypothetical protein